MYLTDCDSNISFSLFHDIYSRLILYTRNTFEPFNNEGSLFNVNNFNHNYHNSLACTYHLISGSYFIVYFINFNIGLFYLFSRFGYFFLVDLILSLLGLLRYRD